MVNLNKEQQAALDAMLAGRNIFLTGEAGTGKSTILREFQERCQGECVFLAPTGVAAINVQGTTLHSFFQLKPGLLTPDNMDDFHNHRRRALIREISTIVIDEISMVRSDLFFAVDNRLRQLASSRDQHKPFGGKQLILVGGFFQLPPVIKTNLEAKYLRSNFGGQYAFQTKLWEDANFQCICLKNVHRQENDQLFLDVLKSIRHGHLTERDISCGDEKISAVDALNRNCLENRRLSVPPVRLCTTNREAISINSAMNAKLESPATFFSASVAGKFNESDFPTESTLELKVGARVMVLCNKHLPDGSFEYVNGDTGIIEAIPSGDSPQVTVKLDKGTTVTLGLNKWSNYDYTLERDDMTGRRSIRQREVGAFVQIPLKLAYAITIHKSQGLTLDCVELHLGGGCFAHGQLYTALSRCRTLRNLRVERPIAPEDLILDQAVVDFYDALEQSSADAEEVQLSVPAQYEEAMRAFLEKLKAQSRKD
ncbi:MAG: PIF1 family ATP-dependent DNA helicase [Lentisphaeria bacterium]|nr:PIF1 family ATP-dependent DNA helicase [Lentisphaeria bacterium]